LSDHVLNLPSATRFVTCVPFSHALGHYRSSCALWYAWSGIRVIYVVALATYDLATARGGPYSYSTAVIIAACIRPIKDLG